MPAASNVLLQVEAFAILLIEWVTTGGGRGDSKRYIEFRERVLADVHLSKLAPRFLRTCETFGAFWAMIMSEHAYWGGRRAFIGGEFEPLINYLKIGSVSPVEDHTTAALYACDVPAATAEWQKALDRVKSGDVDGAITSARSLLEGTCKHILDQFGVSYEDETTLPKLYRLAARSVALAPDPTAEQSLRQFTQGCVTAVEGFSALRNKFGDAHGKSGAAIPAMPHHAALAVNFAGALSVYLIEAWNIGSSTR